MLHALWDGAAEMLEAPPTSDLQALALLVFIARLSPKLPGMLTDVSPAQTDESGRLRAGLPHF
jgi:hypothetical protein